MWQKYLNILSFCETYIKLKLKWSFEQNSSTQELVTKYKISK